MNEAIKENVQSQTTWIRLAYMVLFSVAAKLVEVLVIAILLIQAVLMIITGKTNRNLEQFGKALAVYAGQTIQFLTYSTEDMPYPIGKWPEVE